MKQLLYYTLLLVASFGFSQDLFFSEYAEGSSNNKYLEIYNPTSSEIDLSGYAYPSVANAPTTAGEHEFWNEFDTSATIPANGVYVIAHPSADASILAKADETHTYLSNGNDGYALAKGTESSYTIIDFIGDFEGDPGSGWEVAGVTNATKDHTLVRKSTVYSGNKYWDNSRGTNTDNSEWVVKANEDWSDLGQHTYSPATSASITNITTNTTWSGDKLLAGKVVVDSGVTLTIEPGTVIKAVYNGNPIDASALVVARGGKIEAAGTATLPIVFTTEFDDLTAADVAAGTYVSTVNGAANDLTTRGMWGGIIVLGNATVGTDNGTASIEGIAEGFDFTTYGNATPVDTENSGTMTYLSIRHGGATIANGDEINGLTLGGVGSGTTINHIEIISNDDDGIEFFGGTVDVDHLIIFNQADDAIDIDQDYSGTVTNAYVAMGADSDNVFEIDGNEKTGATEADTVAHAVTNVTAYQEFDNSAKLDQYGHWKSNAKGTYSNVVYKGFAAGTRIEGVSSNTDITFSNFDFVTSDALSAITSDADLTAAAEVISAQAYGSGAAESAFDGWTAYDFNKSAFSSSISVGDGTLTYIDTDTSWTGDVSIAGKVVVKSGATLTIAAGTVVKAAFANDAVDATALVVARGGKIEAAGTAALPIVFTTEFDDLTAADVAAGTYVSTVGGAANDLTTRGMWGGIIVLGNATVGTDNGTASIEGIAEGFDFTTYGNATPVDTENSGTMTYLSIRHGGATIANGDEINGLTLGGVGSGTTINHIEIISNDDDGIEFFGGTVDVDHLIIFNQADDAIDIDQDYSGTVTNAYVAMGADSDNVFEIDGNEKTGATEADTVAHAVTNVTAYQEFDNSAKLDQYGHWKSNAKGTYSNVVYKGFAAGTRIEGVSSNTDITFSNFDFVTSDALSAITSDADLTAAAEVISAQAYGSGAAESAFDGWTAYHFVKNTLSLEDVLKVHSTISFYPNPTNGVVNVGSETRVNEISVYAITGQLVKKAKGVNSINIENVKPGIYIIEVITDEEKVQGKLFRK